MINKHQLQSHIVLVNQKVIDLRLKSNGLLEDEVCRLFRGLQKYLYIPSNKVTAKLDALRIEDGVVQCTISDLTRELDINIHHSFTLGVIGYAGEMDAMSVFSKVEGAEISDGGNIQNTTVNLAWAFLCGPLRDRLESQGISLRLTVVSSSDPFATFPFAQAEAMRNLFEVQIFDLPDRSGIHLPWVDEGENGTLSINTMALSTGEALEKLLNNNKQFAKAFKDGTCFVSADPIYSQLARFAQPGYTYIINASTAFRSEVAVVSYDRSVILPMNEGEAGDVCRLLLQRHSGEELNKIRRPPFTSPLATNGREIDLDGLRQLDRSLDILKTYIPSHRTLNRQSFVCPISFGAQGGLVIGSGSQGEIACFTSTPAKTDRLFEEFCDPDSIDRSRIYEMGAGDAVATIITLFNEIEPRIFIEPFFEGREGENRILIELASTIFVSGLGRVVGNFLIHTRQTNWSCIKPAMFLRLLEEMAQESLNTARTMVNKLHAPAIGEMSQCGIQVVAWRPGQVAYPERDQNLS
ncbi:MAG: hypothetical protein JST85_28350 [Acidobacteria bacterium]|nr:hypothetical protein [Acidobacteriota bacterium]